MKIIPCVDRRHHALFNPRRYVSIPYEDYPLCRLFPCFGQSKLESRFPSPMRISPCVDWTKAEANAFPIWFPSPMRISLCVDSVPNNPVQLCTPAPISKRPTFPQATKSHYSASASESLYPIPLKRDSRSISGSYADKLCIPLQLSQQYRISD